MSKHKLIMENWRKFLSESDRGYREEMPNGDDLYMHHERRGPSGLMHRITLYTVDPNSFYSTELNLKEVFDGIKDVGSIYISQTRRPCIPTTYEVGAIHTAEEFDNMGYGTLLYDLAFLVAAENNWGLTSDRDTGTKTVARSKWAAIAANDSKYEKRKTPEVPIADDSENAPEDAVPGFLLRPQPEPGQTTVGGNDKFDYHFQTPDPDDDCSKTPFPGGGSDNATDHSFMMKDTSEIKRVYDKLENNHVKLMKLIKDMSPPEDNYVQAIQNHILDKSAQGFGDRYDQAKE
tara:strand:- start:215 stop:1084 length:870 start_codon:yes stop_codon:yes gene_type:complete